MWNALSVTSIVFFIFLSHSAIAAPDSEPVGEGRQKESPPAEQKKKLGEKRLDAELKTTDTAPKPAPDEKAAKTEEPPAAAPKPDESGGKKTVTSLNLTIKLALMANPSLFPFEMEVELDGQKAILTGAVPSEDDKAQATEVVRKVEGVESVVNKLAVAPELRSTLGKKEDDAITQYVKERLSKSETLKAVGFDVKSENGVVSLSGKTRFQVIALEAAEAARHIPGVRAVDTGAVQITGKE
jgi:hyperosmotically inducible periplasmic protein